MGTEAVIGGLFGLASAGVQAASAHHTQAANAAAQSELNQATMNFNRVEAAKARDWQARQAVIDRQFASAQQVNTQNFNASQAAKLMDYSHREANIARSFNRNEAITARNWESAEAQKARNFNAQQSLLARQFEERMSSTAHQREIQDLKAAGLNPILSATGGSGASSPVAPILSSPLPSGVSASSSAAQGSAASSSPLGHNTGSSIAAHVAGLNAYMKKDVLAQFVNSALDSMRVANDYTRAKAQDKEADAQIKNAETNELRQKVDEKYINQQIENLKKDNVYKDWQIKSEEQKVRLVKQQIINAVKQQKNLDRLTDAQVSQCGAIAYSAIKNAETDAAYKSKMAEVNSANGEYERRKLMEEAEAIRLKRDEGYEKTHRDFMNSFGGKIVHIVDQTMGALSPIKLKF